MSDILAEYKEVFPAVNEDKLPTSSEIAARGVEDYSQIARILPLKLKALFVFDRRIRRSFVGTQPHVTISPSNAKFSLTQEEESQLREISSGQTSNMLVLKENVNGRPGLSLVNMEAVKLAIDNYPSLFPQQAKADLPSWLTDHQDEWKDETAGPLNRHRLGILSGFPFSAVSVFPTYESAILKILAIPEKDRKKIDYSYLAEYLPKAHKDPKSIVHVTSLFEKSGVLLDPEELALLLEVRGMDTAAQGGFMLFEDPANSLFLQKTKLIYEQSGIDNKAKQIMAAQDIFSKLRLYNYSRDLLDK